MLDHALKLPRKKLICVSSHVSLQAIELLLRKCCFAGQNTSSNVHGFEGSVRHGHTSSFLGFTAMLKGGAMGTPMNVVLR